MSILIKNVVLSNKKKDLLIEDNLISKIDDEINISADEVVDYKGEKVGVFRDEQSALHVV